ncbi:MAG TPA: ABC transporter ATP-binding protein [Syntrophorhabdaceae bacterium]|jgi:lipopolysaccharide transport system ATP-binding protein
MKTIIEVENLSKQYKISVGKYQDSLKDHLTEGAKTLFRRRGNHARTKEIVWALKDVSFEVKQGEIVGFVGRNGAGKSTILKILSRITEPTSGHMKVQGKVASLLEVGTGFHPELSGRENVFLNGAILGMPREEIKRKFDEIVAFAETGRFIDTPVKRYSSGMYVRLAFAVAAHLEPEILLVDEVLAVGDAPFQRKCLGKMGDVAKGGRTVLFVSHNMIAVNSLCSRVVWLENGEKVDDGPAGRVVADYVAGVGESSNLSEEVWEDPTQAPGNDMVRIHRVRVRPEQSSLSEPMTMETPFRVEVEYWNLVPDAQLHITLHLYTDQGLIAFSTASIFDSDWSDRPMPAGLLRSICHFPGKLLNSGQHKFVLLVVQDKSTVIYEHKSAVCFDIADFKERPGAWFGREPGVVQPMLDWKTEVLEETGRDRFMTVNTGQESSRIQG